jgi:hypothetical protein
MQEYFIVANSFAAPFCSDQSTHFVAADTPLVALESFSRQYKHHAGLYSAACYESSDQYHKGRNPVASWLSNHARHIEEAKDSAIKANGSVMTRSNAPGQVEVDGKAIAIKDPKQGHGEYT